MSAAPSDARPVELTTRKSLNFERRDEVVTGPREAALAICSGLSGESGWFYAGALPWLQGIFDQVVGG